MTAERDPEGPAAHLRNAIQIVTLLEYGFAAARTSEDGRVQPEEGGKPAADAHAAVVARCGKAINSHLEELERLPCLNVTDLKLEALQRAHHEAVYAGKCFLTARRQEGGPKQSYLLGNLGALSRRLRAALREVEL